MMKIDCPKLVKTSIILSIFFLVLFPNTALAVSSSNINFQGKIVRNDTGYEGLNVTSGNPSCVVSGNANDTCDFQVKYYSASSGGTLLLTEHYLDVEIGQYNGAFTLSLGSDGSPTAGSYSSFDAMIKGVNDLYVELGFAPGGTGSYTETFSRMPIQASAYALKAKYASGANTAFQFDSAANSSGYTAPVAGMVYYDTTDSELKVYDGSVWGSLGGGGTGSLFTDGGIFTYLSALTDHFVLGSNTYTAIGADSYTTYLTGLSSRAPFSFDMAAERLTVSGSQAQSGLTVYSDYNSTGAWPVVSVKAEGSGFDNVVMQITQDGTGNILSLQKGSTEAFAFENPLTFYIHPRIDNPTITANRLYNVNGTLYWNGSPVGGSDLWTDAGTFTYLTSTTDDVVIGGDTLGTVAFFFDVSTGNFGIGTSTPGAKLDIAGSNSTISNSTGNITISPDDTVVIKANDTQADNLMEWQNSAGTVLGLINQNGYATFGSSTSNTGAMLTLGASTSSVAQINLASGTNVSVPNKGDLWWNGTNLYFYDGSTSVDLLTGNDGNVLSNYGTVSNGGYIGVAHNANSYDVVASGWICVGGSENEACSGGQWKNLEDIGTTITQNLSNQWNNASTSGIIRTTIEATDIKLNSSMPYGIYTSAILSTPNAQSYGSLRWDSVLNTYGRISVQTRSGATSDSTDGTWEAWRPSVATTNYVILQNSDTHTQWVGTNATVAEGDTTRNINFFEDEDEPTGANTTKVTSSTNEGYAESTISATNLSNYDYVTLWVRASQAGNTLRIGIGESVATEQYEDITIDTADIWQKVYWDISDVATSSRDAITKLRITNFSTSSNVIYVDNVKAEKLISVSTGSPVASTPNQYFQYRVIFTTTNLSYQPLLENISFTYNSGYRIVAYDTNNVRLYNYSGESKYLKLSVYAKTGGGADLAEYYPSKQNLLAGEVVSADITNPGYIKRSTQSYDKNLIGVISTNPGMTLGGGERYSDSIYRLALSGRVPVIINPNSEDINIGDYITSSDLPGYAQKATGSGKALGMALESWRKDDGKDRIVVYLSLGAYLSQNTQVEGLSVSSEGMNYTLNFPKQGTSSLLFSSSSLNNIVLDSGGNLYFQQNNNLNSIEQNLTNNTGETVQPNTLVVIDGSSENSFTTTNAYGSTNIYGVLKGIGSHYDMNINGYCDANEICKVQFGGIVYMSLDNIDSAARGDYVYSSEILGLGHASEEYKKELLVGIISSISNNLVAVVLNSSNTAVAQIISNSNSNISAYNSIYTNLSNAYNAMTLAERRGVLNANNQASISFDNLVDGLKMDVQDSTASLDTSLNKLGLWGGYNIDSQTLDSHGNRYYGEVGSTLVSSSYYEMAQEKAQWYKGVSLLSGVTDGFNENLIKVSGSYNQSSEHGFLDITIQETTSSGVIVQINSHDGACFADNINLTFNTDYNFISGSCSGSDIVINLTRADYKVGDKFRILSWYLSPLATNPKEKAFPQNTLLLVTKSSSNTYFTLIDLDTQNVWMKLSDVIPNDKKVSQTYFLQGKLFILYSDESYSVVDFSNDSVWYYDQDNWFKCNDDIADIDKDSEYVISPNTNSYNIDTANISKVDRIFKDGKILGTNLILGNYYSNTMSLSNASSDAMLWLKGYKGVRDSINVYVSNNGGEDYVKGTLLKTIPDVSNFSDYEYYFKFADIGNNYKVRIEFSRQEDKKTAVYITQWYLVPVDISKYTSSGLYSNEEQIIASGDYLEIKHNQSTENLATNAWAYNINTTKWENIDNNIKIISQSNSNDWDSNGSKSINTEVNNDNISSFANYGIYVSPVLETSYIKNFNNIKWDTSVIGSGNISIQTRSGSSSDPSDDTWEAWRSLGTPKENLILENCDNKANWNSSDAAIETSDIVRNVPLFEDENESIEENILKMVSSTKGGFMKFTPVQPISLLGYDYVTLWVRASKAGDTVRLNLSDDQFYDISINEPDIWQKAYLDISGITDWNKNTLSNFKISNLADSENIIYIDNIQAENTLASSGSVVNTTPNQYLQYRVIFSTLENDSQVSIKNILITYSLGFRVEISDSNTVRLYNDTNTAQKLRLNVILGYAAENLVSGNYITIASPKAQIDVGINTNSIWVNKLGTGGNLLKLQANGRDMMEVSSEGNMTLAGDVAISGGTLSLGGDGAGVRYNTTDNTIEFSNDGIVWLPLGNTTRKVTLSAEYAGAVLSGDGTDNVGSMTSDNTGSLSNSMNYYEWNSPSLALNDYDVRVRFTLPSDFNGWGNTGGVTLNFATESTNSTNNKVDMYIYKEGSATIDETSTLNVSTTAGVWKATTIVGTDINECATAGDICVFIVRMSSSNDNYVRVGDIDITYNRSL